MWTSLEKDWGSTFLVVMMNFGYLVQSCTTTRLQLLLKEYEWLTRSNVLKSLSLISHVAAKQNHKRNGRCDHCTCCWEVLKYNSMRLSYPANRKKTSPPWQKPESIRTWEHYKITTCCRFYQYWFWLGAKHKTQANRDENVQNSWETGCHNKLW